MPVLTTDLATYQLIDEIKRVPDDEARKNIEKAVRMLVLRSELVKWVREPNEALEITDGLCNAMAETLRFFLIEDNSLIHWTQHMMLSGWKQDPGSESIVGLNLAASKNSLSDNKLGSIHRLIQSMISLSSLTEEIYSNKIFWVLGSGTHEEVEKWKAQLRHLLPELQNWERGNDGKLYPPEWEGVSGRYVSKSMSFGIRNSSLFVDQ
jgi:hypothetical protein